MNDNFGSLGDFFPEQEVKCRIRGCKNKVHISGDRAMHSAVNGNSHRDMCDQCYELFLTLADKEIPCSTPGCDGKWIWNRYQQLEAHAQGRDSQPPRGFCDKCRDAIKTKGDIEQPCRVRGCKGHWIWTARMQQESRDGKPPRRLCDDCFKIYQTLQDKELPCRVRGCDHKVLWTRQQQLEYLRSGKSLDNPPARMCDDCFKKFNELKPIEQPCRINGCKNTWTCTPYDQLEAMVAAKDGAEPELPKRMCKECITFLNTAKDIELPCVNKGCEHTWTWTRAMQLGAKKFGHTGTPRRMCESCREELSKLTPIDLPCDVDGCHGTSVYSPEEQLRNRLANRQPEKRHCRACQEFLAAHKAVELSCEKCGKVFHWSGLMQLYTSLGTSQKPRFCADCTSQELSELPACDPVIKPAAHPDYLSRIPATGDWKQFPQVRDWPAGMSREAISAMELADKRLVCIGDEMTAEDNDLPSFIPFLAHALQEKFGEEHRVALLNAGMPRCTTAMGLSRIARDVVPTQPQGLLFSFALADAFAGIRGQKSMENLEDDFTAFVSAVRALPSAPKLLCWLPNPIFPQEEGKAELWKTNGAPDSDFIRLYDSVIRMNRTLCEKLDIPTVDCKSLYEMSGQKTALAWLASPYRPNVEGCRSFTNWMVEAIISNGILN